jgi:hypothetical protein
MPDELLELRRDTYDLLRANYARTMLRLKELGITVAPEHPLATRDRDGFFIRTISWCPIHCEFDNVPFSVYITEDYRYEVRVKMWDRLAAGRKKRLMRWQAKDWEDGRYSEFREVNKTTYGNDLTELWAKVKKKIENGKRIKTLREEEVAAGRGREVVW